MNILIISDDPELPSFCQIMILKQDIENLIRKQTDLIVFSSDEIYLNQKLLKKDFRTDTAFVVLQNILNRKTYNVCIISLGQKYLERLFSNELNIIDLVTKSFAKAVIFIFGSAATVRKNGMRKSQNIFFYPRRGVAKITKEFKDQIYRQIKAIK